MYERKHKHEIQSNSLDEVCLPESSSSSSSASDPVPSVPSSIAWRSMYCGMRFFKKFWTSLLVTVLLRLVSGSVLPRAGAVRARTFGAAAGTAEGAGAGTGVGAWVGTGAGTAAGAGADEFLDTNDLNILSFGTATAASGTLLLFDLLPK